MKSLKNYTAWLLELKAFKLNNASIFQDLERIEGELEKAEAELKTEIKAKGKDYENDIIKVSYIEKFRKFYDYDIFMASADIMEIHSLELAKGVKKEIDKTVFEELFNQGLITAQTKQESFREEPLSSAVIIKEKI